MELSSILPSPHSDLLTALAYSPSSSHLLLASADSTLALFRRSPATGLFAADDRWKAHDGPVGGVAWAGEEWGVVCASWGWDRRICVWREDVDEKRNSSRRLPLLWSTVLPPSHGTPQALAFLPPTSSASGLLLSVLTSSGQLVVYTPAGGGMADWYALVSVGLPALVGGGGQGKAVVAGGGESAVGGQLGKMLGGGGNKADGSSTTAAAAAAAVGAGAGAGKAVRRLSWCREPWWGLVFATSLDATGAVYIFTLQTPTSPPLLLSTLSLPSPSSSPSPANASSPASQTALAWAPSCGRSYHLIATGSRDGVVRVWRVVPGSSGAGSDDGEEDGEGGEGGAEWKGRCVAELADHGAAVTQLEWNVTGTVLSSSADDGTTRLWKATYANRWACAAVFDAEPAAPAGPDGADAEMA